MKEMVWNAAKIITCPTLVDYFPILKAIDPQGVRRRAKVHYGKLFDIMDGVIRQRSQERDTSITYLRKSDFLETLLDVNQQNGPVWSYEDMKHLIMDLLLGGTETSSVSVEWTMAELLRNPENKTKARDEIRKVIGQNKLVKESDISNLPYLQSVIKETFRLRPPSPFLIRQPQSDTEINGYVGINVQVKNRTGLIKTAPIHQMNSPIPDELTILLQHLKRFFELFQGWTSTSSNSN